MQRWKEIFTDASLYYIITIPHRDWSRFNFISVMNIMSQWIRYNGVTLFLVTRLSHDNM